MIPGQLELLCKTGRHGVHWEISFVYLHIDRRIYSLSIFVFDQNRFEMAAMGTAQASVLGVAIIIRPARFCARFLRTFSIFVISMSRCPSAPFPLSSNIESASNSNGQAPHRELHTPVSVTDSVQAPRLYGTFHADPKSRDEKRLSVDQTLKCGRPCAGRLCAVMLQPFVLCSHL